MAVQTTPTITTTSGPYGGLFGRRPLSDPSDLWYLLADREPGVFEALTAPLPPVRSFRGPVYDQAGAPTDVACAMLAALHAAPRRIGPGRSPSVEQLDRAARELEGALGPGLALRSACRVLKRLGLINGYAWTYDIGEVRRWLRSGRGGLVLGLDWYAAMTRPDPHGLIRSWGRPLGGHAVYAWGYDPLTDSIQLQNSWGPDWGGWSTRPGRHDFKGCARLPCDDLKKLLADNGEAVALFKHPRVVRLGEGR